MGDEYLYTTSSRYLQKWLRYDIKHVKNRHFSRHFGTYRDFQKKKIPILTLQKVL